MPSHQEFHQDFRYTSWESKGNVWSRAQQKPSLDDPEPTTEPSQQLPPPYSDASRTSFKEPKNNSKTISSRGLLLSTSMSGKLSKVLRHEGRRRRHYLIKAVSPRLTISWTMKSQPIEPKLNFSPFQLDITHPIFINAPSNPLTCKTKRELTNQRSGILPEMTKTRK